MIKSEVVEELGNEIEELKQEDINIDTSIRVYPQKLRKSESKPLQRSSSHFNEEEYP